MSIRTSQAYYNLKVGVRPIFIWKIFRRAVISSQKEPPIILKQLRDVSHKQFILTQGELDDEHM